MFGEVHTGEADEPGGMVERNALSPLGCARRRRRPGAAAGVDESVQPAIADPPLPFLPVLECAILAAVPRSAFADYSQFSLAIYGVAHERSTSASQSTRRLPSSHPGPGRSSAPVSRQRGWQHEQRR